MGNDGMLNTLFPGVCGGVEGQGELYSQIEALSIMQNIGFLRIRMAYLGREVSPSACKCVHGALDTLFALDYLARHLGILQQHSHVIGARI